MNIAKYLVLVLVLSACQRVRGDANWKSLMERERDRLPSSPPSIVVPKSPDKSEPPSVKGQLPDEEWCFFRLPNVNIDFRPCAPPRPHGGFPQLQQRNSTPIV